MNDKELDNLLKGYFKDQTEDASFNSRVDGMVRNIYKKREKKKMLLFIIPMLLTSTTVLAISYNIFNLSSVGIDDQCLEIATQNGYIQNFDTTYQTYDNLGIKINHFLIDDMNFDISFEYEISDMNLHNVKNVFIQDLYIYDENNNIIYQEESENSNVFLDIADSMGYSKIRKISENTFENTFFAQSNNFPKSKKTYIEFKKVILHCNNGISTFNGLWKFEIDVPDFMINRENINYKCISNNSTGNISIKNVKLTNTGLFIEAISGFETLNNSKISVIVDNKKYKANNNLFELNMEENIRANIVNRIYTFNLTKYNIPNEIKVRVKDKSTERDIVFIKDE